ncbi:MAG: DUF4395 family protein, partial [Campylobacterota bacterium]|nr:DUF4395 family protein [Campylobacterota bacterium]
MSYSCPLSFEQIDSNVSRITSLFVSSLIITYLFTFNIVIIYFLLFEFIMKFFCKKELTITHKSAIFIKKLLKLEDKIADSGAKRLAGYFAIFF